MKILHLCLLLANCLYVSAQEPEVQFDPYINLSVIKRAIPLVKAHFAEKWREQQKSEVYYNVTIRTLEIPSSGIIRYGNSQTFEWFESLKKKGAFLPLIGGDRYIVFQITSWRKKDKSQLPVLDEYIVYFCDLKTGEPLGMLKLQ